METSPVTKAHGFSLAAEQFEQNGDLQAAVEAHFRAAEQFLAAQHVSEDVEAQKTLKMLYNNHTRRGKELQSRLTRPESFEFEAREVESFEQQLTLPVIKLAPSSPKSSTGSLDTSMEMGSRQFFVGQGMLSGMLSEYQNVAIAKKDGHVATLPIVSLDESTLKPPIPLKPPPVEIPAVEDEELASELIEMEKTDKFWDVVEGFVSKISKGAAGLTEKVKKVDLSNGSLKSKLGQVLPPKLANPRVFGYPERREYDVPIQEDQSGDSFLIVGDSPVEQASPSNVASPKSPPTVSEELERIVQENHSLRETVASLTSQLDTMSTRLPSEPTIPTDTLLERIAELESQLEQVNAEKLEMEQALNRYKDRWNRLKESAKRKKEEREVKEVTITRRLSGPEEQLKGLALIAAERPRKTDDNSLSH